MSGMQLEQQTVVLEARKRRRIGRRAWIGGATAAGIAGLGTYIYRQAPSFWRQYVEEMQRPIAAPTAVPQPHLWPDRGVHAAWLGHTTVLVKIEGYTLITDPVLSDRAGLNLGPITLGVKRLVAPALDFGRLPRIDLILLSHAHMDHFDVPTLRRLEDRGTEVITASKTSDLLRTQRYSRVREMGWRDREQAGPLSIRAIQVNHWGARMRSDTWRGYNGYVLEAGRYRVLFAGDTADTSLFKEVKGARPYDLAIFPIGAYNPWIRYHCTPEQAWRMGNEAGADRFLPVHHRTFRLSREPLGEPMERFHEAAGARGAERIVAGQIGREFHLS